MNPKLSILICTLPERKDFLNRLFDILDSQLSCDVEVHTDPWPKPFTIGQKRNHLLLKAKGDYICFIDDDDRVSENYISLLMEGINKGIDCCSLTGIITEDGNNPLVFQHSIKYQQYKTNPEGMPVRYERYPNHLNCIKASIAKQFRFPEINHGEDTDFATQIFKSGLIKTEHWIEDVIYHYDYRSKK
jgi:glycosyltransferase involved in cell wall biosynthesis